MSIKPSSRQSGSSNFVGGGLVPAARAVAERDAPAAPGSAGNCGHPNTSTLERSLLQILEEYVGEIMARSVLTHCTKMCGVGLGGLRPGDAEKLSAQLDKGLRLYVHDQSRRDSCIAKMTELMASNVASESRRYELEVTTEADIVTARNIGRDLCKTLGFNVAVQTRVATAVSELARNIVQYTPGGTMELSTMGLPRRGIIIVARDRGKGISNLDDIMAGRYASRTGMGKGLVGTKQLMDTFHVKTGSTGTEITTRKYVTQEAASRRSGR